MSRASGVILFIMETTEIFKLLYFIGGCLVGLGIVNAVQYYFYKRMK